MSALFGMFRGRKALPTQLVAGAPNSVTKKMLIKLSKTTDVIVEPSVIGKCIQQSSRHQSNEVAGLLLGRIDGRYLLVEDVVPCERVGTATTVHFSARDFDKALDAKRDDQVVVGWFHSHPRLGVFMSGTDITHQTQGEGLFPDYVGLVMDPFRADGIDFAFFRVKDSKFVQIPHHYYLSGVDK